MGHWLLKWGYRTVGCALTACVLTFSTSALADDDGGWKLDPDARVELGLVTAETATRDEDIIVNGDAFTLRGQIGFDLEDDDTSFRVEVDRIEVIRFDEDRDDTARDRITASFDQKLDADWEVQLRGRYYHDYVTAESSDTDEIQGSVRVTYEPKREHRVRVRASWRERNYDNAIGPSTDGEGPRVDAKYRHRFGRYHYATVDLRAESISSDDPRRCYERESAKVSYTQPITPDLRVRPAIELLKTRFDERFTLEGERRKDTLVVPELEMHYWPGRFRVEAEAKYIFSDSTLLSRQREGYRLTLSVGYVF